MSMNNIYLGTGRQDLTTPSDLIIQLKVEDGDFVKNFYENIIIKYGKEELKISSKKLFDKLKELFGE